MSSTDDRIVRMQFENRQFMKGAADSQKALADTNKAIDGAGKSKGLLDLNSQMQTVGVTASKMSIITTTALATITNKVVNTGLQMAKALTINPIKEGFLEYEQLLTKQNVIMNATGKSAGEVKGYLNELNEYSDKTIYSFSNMTDSITKFVNAGVDLPTSVTSIKGIANAAAFAGATTQEANRAMYAFSQSMQTGFIMLNDWMQIENANMGTMQFKEELLKAGVAAGTLTKRGNEYITSTGKAITAGKGWREGLREQWATTEVLNKALGKYADETTGLGKKAFKSAQDVRTFTAFMDTLKESIASGWSAVFTSLIGNLKQATKFWTGFSEAVAGSVDSFFTFVSTAIKTWRQMGGFEKTLQAFKNILAPFAALLGAIGDAWSAAFPSSNKGAGKALYGLSAGLELLTRPLAWLAKGIPVITGPLTFFFNVLKGGINIIKTVVTYLVDLVKNAAALGEIEAPDAGGFMGFLATVVSFAKAGVDALGELVSKAKSIGGSLKGLKLPSMSLPSVPSGGGEAAAGAGSSALSAAQTAASKIQTVMSKISSGTVKMGEILKSVWDKLTGFFSKISAEDLVYSFNTAIFATLAISITRFFNAFTKGFKGITGLAPAFIGVMDSVSDSLSGFAQAAKREAMAKMIISLAIALGILAVSLWILSKVPVKQLLPALAALTFLMIRMTATVSKITDSVAKMKAKGTAVNAIALSVALVALGLSLILLATSAKIMDSVNLDGVVKSVVTMFAMMQVVKQIGSLAAGSSRQILSAATAFIAISTAMVVMAGALLLFQLVKWESIGKAGAVLGGLTLAIGALALIPYAGIAKVGQALLAASVGILALANALILFALVKWESILKAGVVLGALALAVGLILGASGGGAGAAIILSLAAAMVALATACIMFNAVDWESIAKAAVVLGILTVGVAAMAAILTVFLYAVAPVAPVLLILAAGFALLGVGLLAFSAAMTIAVGLAAAGTAAFAALATGAAVAIGVFLQTLALQSKVMKRSILEILQNIIDTIVEAVPMIIQGFKDLWKAILKEMSSGDKKKSFGEIAEEWLMRVERILDKYTPILSRLATTLALGILEGMVSKTDKFVEVGVDFLTKLMRGLERNRRKLINTAIDLIVSFADGIRRQTKKITDAGIDLIAGFLHDLADSIRQGKSKIGSGINDVVDAFRGVGRDMVSGMIGGVGDKFDEAMGAIGNLASGMVNKAKGILDIFSPSRVFKEIGKFLVQGLTKGIQENAASSIVAVASMITGSIAVADEYVSSYLQKLDQQAIAARGKAQGLAAAAEKARKSANRTKDKDDNKAAKALTNRAKAAADAAKKEEKAAADARKAAARREKWEKADSAGRAKIRAEQAESQLAGAKDAEKAAEAARIQAAALRAQAKKAGTAKERKALINAANAAAKEAKAQAERANKLIEGARKNSVDALKYQKLAGEEAAAAFQKLFEEEAKADADAKAFEKLSNEEKAAKRREQADALQKKADEDLARAKQLAMTDLSAANALAQAALEEAEQARQLRDEAEQFANGGATGTTGPVQVVDVYQTEAAAAAYNKYADLYESATAAAAAGARIEFNQYNTSPESLSEAQIYRNTNNQLTYAGEHLVGATK